MDFIQSGDALVFTQDRGGQDFVIAPTDTTVTSSGGPSGGLSAAAIQALFTNALNLDNINHDDPKYVEKDFASLPPLP